VVIAAPGSGQGKTTVATGLMGALRAEGRRVAGFKIGPDYIDPGYHALATGRPGRNLDPVLCGSDRLVPLLLHGAAVPEPADVAVIEGVLGLFDGRLGGDGFASTAQVATLIDAPVILVLDISHTARTAAAIVHGLATFDPGVRVAGVILNKAGSARHADEVVRSLATSGFEVLGVLPRDAGIEAPSRHLGLVPAAERADAAGAIHRLAEQIAANVSLAAITALAKSATPLTNAAWNPETEVRRHPSPVGGAPVVAIAGGRAFSFRYPETDELLRAAGCEPVVFDPLTDTELPAGTAGLYLGGGFPEVHAAELSANEPLRSVIRTAIADGLPTVAECAGLLYLCRSVDGAPMIGAIVADARMSDRLTLGYRTAVADHDHLLASAGWQVSGHEFHRTVVQPGAGTSAGWVVDGEPVGFSADPGGTGRPTLHASYLHVHWAGHPELAQRFADAVHDHVARRSDAPGPGRRAAATIHDLHHHGDDELGDGLLDIAVNVRLPRPPDWLQAVINGTTDQLAGYPRQERANAAIAAAHHLDLDQVLPTSGGAEAFTLIARARPWQKPVVVHPQFTEPEAALRAAGHRPARVILPFDGGFRIEPDLIPADADLVLIGNPTNPTSVLHSHRELRALVRPGRVLVVDEAFMDAVPGETESMITSDMTGLVVVRSLTKTWGLAGLRTGYALGDPLIVDAMRAQQPHWSVSSPALACIEACLSPRARDEAALAALEVAEERAILVRLLDEIGLRPLGSPAAPFVLLDTGTLRGDHQPGWVRLALRERAIAVRRGDTFPGLGPDWIRVTVRDAATSRRFVDALGSLLQPAESADPVRSSR
jgi:cobyrinic acid a,c-diamide synthase